MEYKEVGRKVYPCLKVLLAIVVQHKMPMSTTLLGIKLCSVQKGTSLPPIAHTYTSAIYK